MKTNVINTAKKSDDFFIESIIEMLDSTDLQQWQHFAKDLKVFNPYNPFTNKGSYYQGINKFFLTLVSIFKGYTNPNFATFNQIQSVGGKLKKGSKHIKIDFFGHSIKHKETGKRIDLDLFKLLSIEEQNQYNYYTFLDPKRVFNFQDIANLEDLDLSKFRLEDNQISLTIDYSPIDEIELFINSLEIKKGLNLRRFPTVKALYNPLLDYVQIPTHEIFISQREYYSTTFHEFVHWTGHPNRLNRFDTKRFESEEYAQEELVAELGALLLCMDFNIFDTFSNSVAYLKGWLNTNDKASQAKKLRSALSLSKKAVKFLI